MRKPAKPNARDISDEKLEDLKLNARGILAEVRRAMLDRFPFIGGIAMNLDLVPTRDSRNPTAATDGQKIFFDISFLSTLTNDERLFILSHECWHNALAHFLRQECRDRELFNIATDMEVNDLLRSDGMTPPLTAILPEKHGFERGLSAEEYYELLINKKKQEEQFNSKALNKGNGKSDKQPNSGNDNSGDSEPQESEKPVDNSGNKDGKLDGQFDKHIYNGDKLSEDDNSDVEDKWGKVGHDDEFMPDVNESSIERIREAAIASAQQMERQRGELPAHLKRFVSELLTPEIPWTEVLCQFISRCMGEKVDWSRPNRRFVASKTYLPSHYGESLKVAVGIDTSGSTGPFMKKFISELNGLVRGFGNYELHLVECDAEVGKYERYDECNPLDLENSEYHVTGGGGTRLNPIFKKLEDEQVDIDCAVIFTDGETEHFYASMDPGYPVLWVLTNKEMAKNFELGETIHFNEKA